ncbi:galactose oxidase [Mycena latifolia]|nr:galactose oxidase [Mycena latifolia]
MAKKKSAQSNAKAAKKAKAAQKIERTTKKKAAKSKKEEEDSDDDLEGILEKLRVEWEEAHKVTEELADGPPSRRANATLTACPNGNHIWCIGGEFFSEDGKAYFYSDVYRYSPDKDEWRRFISPTCPGPRSAHAVAVSPAGGGKIFLFGSVGEFSSLHQNSFHHYRDFWSFDIQTHSWDRIDTKIRPSARSGHRMAIWKHFIVLFGGFYDPGVTTRYLNDLWLFDLQEYKWRQIEFKENDIRPSPRSGFSFLSTADGIILHGGYCKEYAKGKRPVGVMLEDTWFLKLSMPTTDPANANAKPATADPLVVKWERRKRPSTAYAPALRSGCTMTLWPAKNTGILFGGVTDEDTGEETLESVFWNDLNGYQLAGKGKWVSMTLKRPKNKSKAAGKKKNQAPASRPENYGDTDDEEATENAAAPQPLPVVDVDPDDPILTTPLPRYNAMLAVLRNTLYIYGGIYERGKREYTLDDFYSIQLDKMDRYTCLKESGIVIADDDDSSSSEDDDDDDDEDDDEEDDEMNYEGDMPEVVEQADPPAVPEDVVVEPTADEQAALRVKATAFMGVSKERSPEELLSTPLPGETLAMFYARSRAYWAQKAHESTENQGKQLRRDGFALAEETYDTYKPILKEVEKILAEAGLDEEDMRQRAAGGGVRVEQSRNRR